VREERKERARDEPKRAGEREGVGKQDGMSEQARERAWASKQNGEPEGAGEKPRKEVADKKMRFQEGLGGDPSRTGERGKGG
jgi:hypothetical protein